MGVEERSPKGPMLLTDLEVTCVSLVDRAAVRDPANPTEPQRFLLWKRETTKEDDMTNDEIRAQIAKIEAQTEGLRKRTAELVRERELVSKADHLAKALSDVEMARAQAGRMSLTQRAEFADRVRPLQLAYLQETNPRAAEAWEQARVA